MQFSLGKPDETWQKYGLTQAPILFNNAKTPYKAIIREGKLISILGKNYFLLPNEEVLELATQAAEMAGLQPFTEGGVRSRAMIKHGHIFYNKDKTVMHAWFAPKNNTIEVNGEKMHIGCNVINSIDGSTSFGCSVFTFRHICSNGVIFGYKQISGVRHIHTKSLGNIVKQLKTMMLQIMDKGNETIEKYRLLAEQEVTENLIEKIRKSRLPKKILPDYITNPEEVAINLSDLTKWELYNDITEAIWHNSSSGLKTKQFQFQTLHQILKV